MQTRQCQLCGGTGTARAFLGAAFSRDNLQTELYALECFGSQIQVPFLWLHFYEIGCPMGKMGQQRPL